MPNQLGRQGEPSTYHDFDDEVVAVSSEARAIIASLYGAAWDARAHWRRRNGISAQLEGEDGDEAGMSGTGNTRTAGSAGGGSSGARSWMDVFPDVTGESSTSRRGRDARRSVRSATPSPDDRAVRPVSRYGHTNERFDEVWDRLVEDLAVAAGIDVRRSREPGYLETAQARQLRRASSGFANPWLNFYGTPPGQQDAREALEEHLVPHPIWARRYAGPAGEWLRGELRLRSGSMGVTSLHAAGNAQTPRLRPWNHTPVSHSRFRTFDTLRMLSAAEAAQERIYMIGNAFAGSSSMASGDTESFVQSESSRRRRPASTGSADVDLNSLAGSLRTESLLARYQALRQALDHTANMSASLEASLPSSSATRPSASAQSATVLPAPLPISTLTSATSVPDDMTPEQASDLVWSIAAARRAARERAAAADDSEGRSPGSASRNGRVARNDAAARAGTRSRATQGGLDLIRRLRRLDGLTDGSEDTSAPATIASPPVSPSQTTMSGSAETQAWEIFPWYDPQPLALPSTRSAECVEQRTDDSQHGFDPDGDAMPQDWYSAARARMLTALARMGDSSAMEGLEEGNAAGDGAAINPDPDGDRYYLPDVRETDATARERLSGSSNASGSSSSGSSSNATIQAPLLARMRRNPAAAAQRLRNRAALVIADSNPDASSTSASEHGWIVVNTATQADITAAQRRDLSPPRASRSVMSASPDTLTSAIQSAQELPRWGATNESGLVSPRTRRRPLRGASITNEDVGWLRNSSDSLATFDDANNSQRTAGVNTDYQMRPTRANTQPSTPARRPEYVGPVRRNANPDAGERNPSLSLPTESSSEDAAREAQRARIVAQASRAETWTGSEAERTFLRALGGNVDDAASPDAIARRRMSDAVSPLSSPAPVSSSSSARTTRDTIIRARISEVSSAAARARQLIDMTATLQDELAAHRRALADREASLRADVERRRLELDQYRRAEGRIGRVLESSEVIARQRREAVERHEAGSNEAASRQEETRVPSTLVRRRTIYPSTASPRSSQDSRAARLARASVAASVLSDSTARTSSAANTSSEVSQGSSHRQRPRRAHSVSLVETTSAAVAPLSIDVNGDDKHARDPLHSQSIDDTSLLAQRHRITPPAFGRRNAALDESVLTELCAKLASTIDHMARPRYQSVIRRALRANPPIAATPQPPLPGTLDTDIYPLRFDICHVMHGEGAAQLRNVLRNDESRFTTDRSVDVNLVFRFVAAVPQLPGRPAEVLGGGEAASQSPSALVGRVTVSSGTATIVPASQAESATLNRSRLEDLRSEDRAWSAARSQVLRGLRTNAERYASFRADLGLPPAAGQPAVPPAVPASAGEEDDQSDAVSETVLSASPQDEVPPIVQDAIPTLSALVAASDAATPEVLLTDHQKSLLQRCITHAASYGDVHSMPAAQILALAGTDILRDLIALRCTQVGDLAVKLAAGEGNRHAARSPTFTLTKLILKVPPRAGDRAAAQGLVFVSLNPVSAEQLAAYDGFDSAQLGRLVRETGIVGPGLTDEGAGLMGRTVEGDAAHSAPVGPSPGPTPALLPVAAFTLTASSHITLDLSTSHGSAAGVPTTSAFRSHHGVSGKYLAIKLLRSAGGMGGRGHGKEEEGMELQWVGAQGWAGVRSSGTVQLQ